MVGERSLCSEAKGVSHGGAQGSENVGTSNHNSGEIPEHRKPKVSLAMEISQGLVGPKPMAKAAGDGQQVNIPALPQIYYGVTKEKRQSALLDLRSLSEKCFLGKSGKLL